MATAAARILTLLVSTSVVPCGACRQAFLDSRATDTATVPFTVVHKAPTGRPLTRPPFRYMHYYPTEVRNVSDRPLKFVWFEGYGAAGDAWYPGNVLGRALREEEFSAWYTEGDTITHGTIPPGGTAVCDVNWHGSNSPGSRGRNGRSSPSTRQGTTTTSRLWSNRRSSNTSIMGRG